MPDVLGFMRKAFPVVSAFANFAGPLGTVAAGMVGKVLRVKALDASPDAISAAIAGATPDQMLQLRQVEAELQAKMQEMGFQHVEELEKLAVDDRASARNVQIATKSQTVPALAWLVVVSFTAS